MFVKKVYFPIFYKLMLLMILFVVSSTIFTGIKNADVFEKILVEREETESLISVRSKSQQLQNLLLVFSEKAKFYALELIKAKLSHEGQEVIELKLKQDLDIVLVHVIEIGKEKESTLSVSSLGKEFLDKDYAEFISKSSGFDFTSLKGNLVVQKYQSNDNFLEVFVALTLDNNNVVDKVARVLIKKDKLLTSFNDSEYRNLYYFDSDFNAVLYSSIDALNASAVKSRIDIFKNLFNSQQISGQTYQWINGKRSLLAFHKPSLGGIVIFEVDESIIKAPSIYSRAQSYYILGIAISIGFYLIYLISFHVTNPISKLMFSINEIKKGNFEVNSSEEVKSRDEVEKLAIAIDDMAQGLKEREKIKTMFNKFHGSSVTEELLKSQIDIRGEKKPVTVFFSDIRGFTDFSEHHTAEEVVEMLNEYFEIMVACIHKHGGIVDKFIGDAIMAVWGVPTASPNDATNAIRACLDMRMALVDFNNRRISRGQDPIKIGMGLNSGHVISGTIGSDERMEFTVIGDTVNTASRIEASTKSFGTDLLISEETKKLVSHYSILSLAGEVGAKGKSDNLTLYKVDGFWREDGLPEIIQTKYSSYEAEKSEKIKVVA